MDIRSKGEETFFSLNLISFFASTSAVDFLKEESVGICLSNSGIIAVRTHSQVQFVVTMAFDFDSGGGKCPQGIFMSGSSSS